MTVPSTCPSPPRRRDGVALGATRGTGPRPEAPPPTRPLTAAAAAPPDASTGDAGLLTPFWIDAGTRVLAVGSGPDGLVQGLARRGADVTVIEAAASAARRLGRRSVRLKNVTVLQSTLSRMRSTAATRHRSFDVLVHVPVADELGVERATPPVGDVIAAAAELLRASGTLVIAVANPWGLRVMLEGARPVAGPGALGLRATLDASGFREQRWLIPYPDPATPEVIVDARLLGSEEGVGIAEVFVRRPVREQTGASRLADPVSAFRSAAEAGLATSVADWFLVAAMRAGASDASIVREGLLFIPPDPERQPAWAEARELERIGGRWLVHPSDSYAPIVSGPFTLEPRTVAMPAGINGEDVVVEALAARTRHPGGEGRARGLVGRGAGGDRERRRRPSTPRHHAARLRRHAGRDVVVGGRRPHAALPDAARDPRRAGHRVDARRARSSSAAGSRGWRPR